VQNEKLHEIDHLAREAMTGQVMLRRWGDALAAGDPFFADEVKLFSDLARVGKGDVIADTIDTYCRESRGAG
jgi:glutamate mutase epsilon subunit